MIENVLALIMCASIGCLAYSIGLVAKKLQEVCNVLQKIREEIEYVPYPIYPTTGQQNHDWWQNPSVTCKYDATFTNITSDSNNFTPVRDAMTGRNE